MCVVITRKPTSQPAFEYGRSDVHVIAQATQLSSVPTERSLHELFQLTSMPLGLMPTRAHIDANHCMQEYIFQKFN